MASIASTALTEIHFNYNNVFWSLQNLGYQYHAAGVCHIVDILLNCLHHLDYKSIKCQYFGLNNTMKGKMRFNGKLSYKAYLIFCNLRLATLPRR